MKLQDGDSILTRLEESVSSWMKMKRVIAWVMKYKQQLHLRTKKESITDKKEQLNVDLMEKAGKEIIKMVQRNTLQMVSRS